LYIVGTGLQKEEVESLVAALDLQEKVKLLGFKQGQELKDLVANSRCVCLPSEWYENGPYSIMEAMAAGKIAIVSNLGGLPEMVQDGVTGFVAAAKDLNQWSAILQKVATMPEFQLTQMGQAATERAKELFDCENYIRIIEQKYKDLLRTKR
jgi:glycosyltransferase involved in cell wall biosynthesis